METLYEDKKEWSISWSENSDGSYTLTTTHGHTNGKMVTHTNVITSGKNIGKKNETTILEQTKLEAKSAWDKKKKQGYHTRDETPPPILKPMLAITYEPSLDKFPYWVQPKLDGVRCLIYKKGSDIIFQSRQNTLYEPFEHLLPELSLLFQHMPHHVVLDGELYTHGMGFDTIVSMVRRQKTKHPQLQQLKYTLYDFFTLPKNTLPYADRLHLLNQIMDLPFQSIQIIPTHIVHSTKEINTWLNFYESEHYEGIMIRGNGMYKDGRSNDLIKYKKFMDDEFQVVNHHESKTNIPVFECKTSDGKLFSVMMAESMENKQEKMKNISDYYGKWLTVKYQELSKDGIPRFPIGISFRDYE
jgi:ATP-dependent DNA ligase